MPFYTYASILFSTFMLDFVGHFHFLNTFKGILMRQISPIRVDHGFINQIFLKQIQRNDQDKPP